MIAAIISSVVGLASSAAFVWSILEVYTVSQQHPGMPIPDAARIAAGKYGLHFYAALPPGPSSDGLSFRR